MTTDNQITVVGNLVDDPELRYTANQIPVCSFTVAVNRRVKGADGQWTDGEATFIKCNVWRQVAENVAESLSKGTRVIVVGSLRIRSFDGQDGQKKWFTEIEVDHVGPSLQWAKTTVERQSRDSSAPVGVGASTGGGYVGPVDDEPPF